MRGNKRQVWLAGCLGLAGCVLACAPAVPGLKVFHAPQLAPAIKRLALELGRTLGATVSSEVAGSQTLVRMVTDLGRECDLLLLADAELYKSLAASRVTWRLEFAHDEMVLAVGSRARKVDQAERDWAAVVSSPEIVLARVNEDLGPIGYRTLLVWRLWELQGHPGFLGRLRSRTMPLAEHAEQLAAMLKSGDAEYGFLYRTTCQAHEIRFIALPPAINLGATDQRYEQAEVTYQAWDQGQQIVRTVQGRLITSGATIPSQAPQPELATSALKYLFLEKNGVFAELGFNIFPPRFFGTREDHQAIAPWADYGGDF